jgi:GT2 family glycosyltransferase
LNRVSVLIVNYNGGELVSRCVESVYQDAAGLALEVIVIDNASADSSADVIAGRFPAAWLVRNDQNVGFARAVNQALRLAGGDPLILLNNDAYFLPGGLPRLLAFMAEHAEADVVGPKVLNPDGTIQPSCFRFPTFRDIFFESLWLSRLFSRSDFFNHSEMGGFQHDALIEVDWVLGACMAVRRSAVDAAGPLDEHYFMYSEELDWCKTMRQAGQHIFYWPEPTIVHYGQQQSRRSQRVQGEVLARGFQSRYYYFEKHYGRGYARWVRLATIAGMALRLVVTWPAAWLGRRPDARASTGKYLAVLKASLGQAPSHRM